MIHGVIWLLLLVPVIFIEAVVLKKMMEWKYGYAFGSSFYANLVSTLLGFPIVYVVASVFFLTACYWGKYFFPSYAHDFQEFNRGFWFAGGESSKEAAMGFAMTLLLLPLYWYISSLIEFYCLKKKVEAEQVDVLKKASFRINAASYALLAILLGWFAYGGYSNAMKPKKHLMLINNRLESAPE